MIQPRIWSVLLVVAVLSAAGAVDAADKPIELPGAIEAVTVYRGQALVTRVIEVDLPAGASDLIVTDLPAQIISDSLHASGDADVVIRAVRYRTRAVREEPREEVRKIDKQIEAVQALTRQNQASQKLRAQKETYLANLETFTAGKVKEDAAKGVLNFETVKAMTGFLFEQRSTLAKEAMKLAEEARGLTEQLSLLQRQRAKLASRGSRTAREAVLSVEKRGRGKAAVRLSYLVGQSSWSPMYNLRGDGEGKGVEVEYNALVQQMSGEDWTAVKVVLSTASPTMVAEAPLLTPLWVALVSKPAVPVPAAVLYNGQRAYGKNLRSAARQRKIRPTNPDYSALTWDWDVNVWANKLQLLDLVAQRDALLAGRVPEGIAAALSVNYPLPGKITVASRSDQQMIQIATLKLQGKFYYQAAPLLTPYVYQQADIVNTTQYALLSGPVSAYLGGQFMGTGHVPMVAKGQRFTVGFGVDPQLRTGRELVDKGDLVRGGNRELTFKYRLLMSNYKDKPVQVRLVDRLPDPRGADIRVTLTPPKDPLSADKVYLRTIRKMGILRWEVEVPAKASGASARMVEYEFKMEFDRKLHIGEPTPQRLEQQKREFGTELQHMMMSQ